MCKSSILQKFLSLTKVHLVLFELHETQLGLAPCPIQGLHLPVASKPYPNVHCRIVGLYLRVLTE